MLDKIKELCKQRGISVSQLEQELGFGNKAIYKWDYQTPGIDRVKAVADYFGVTIDYLISDEMSYDEREQLLEKAFNGNKDKRILFSLSDKCSNADLKRGIRIFKAILEESEDE